MMPLTDSFLVDLGHRVHDLTTDQIKLAFYTTPATSSITAYTSAAESSGGTYVAGGVVLSGSETVLPGAFQFTWDDVEVNGSITIASALIYNATRSNKSIACFPVGPVSLGSGGLILELSKFPLRIA